MKRKTCVVIVAVILGIAGGLYYFVQLGVGALAYGRQLPIKVGVLHSLTGTMANLTSDYYQADESWWVDAYNAGSGRSFYGDIEYDESARTFGIALYAPVYGDQGEAIGVVKAFLNLDEHNVDEPVG